MPRKTFSMKDYVRPAKSDCVSFVALGSHKPCQALNELMCATRGKCSFYKRKDEPTSRGRRKGGAER